MARPTKMTPEIIAMLERGFAYGYTDVEACAFAGITKTTLYNYQEKNPEFVDRKEMLKGMPSLSAKKNVVDALQDGDTEVSKWYLERRNRDEFSTKSNQDVNNSGEITINLNKTVHNARDND